MRFNHFSFECQCLYKLHVHFLALITHYKVTQTLIYRTFVCMFLAAEILLDVFTHLRDVWVKISRKHRDLFISKLTLFLSSHMYKSDVNINGKAQQRNEKQLSASDNGSGRLMMKTDGVDLRHDDLVLFPIQPETEPATLSSKVFIYTPLSLWPEQTICSRNVWHFLPSSKPTLHNLHRWHWKCHDVNRRSTEQVYDSWNSAVATWNEDILTCICLLFERWGYDYMWVTDWCAAALKQSRYKVAFML